jgi:hypothetical protein
VTRVTVAKLTLGITGIGLFLWANRDEQRFVRWVAVSLVVVAWLLRFAERGQRRSSRQGPSM